jgi:hypothetical protein
MLKFHELAAPATATLEAKRNILAEYVGLL